MFESTLILDSGQRRPWTILASVTGQFAAVGFMMLIPLIYTDKLAPFGLMEYHILPPIGRPAPPPEMTAVQPRQATSRQEFRPPGSLTAPVTMPARAQIIIDAPVSAVAAYDGPYVEGGVPYSGPSSAIGIPNAVGVVPPLPAEAKPRLIETVKAAEPVRQTIRVGGDVQAAKLLRRVIPTYPVLAKQARVSGTVELLGVIGKDGTVQQLRVISGHALLVPAAVEAVRQWTYRPTLLNGEPVEVVAPIAVHFILQQ